MATKKPTFITGANAKIKVGGKTFAYASDVSYQVQVDTIPIETMGRYEAVTNEPVNYSVAGELSVVRYTNSASGQGMQGAAAEGNGLGKVTGGSDFGDTKASDHLNPGSLLLSQTFDVSVYQKLSTGDNAEVIKITDCRFTRKSAGISKRGVLVDRLSFVGILADDESFDASHSGDSDLA
jgi:hypothetical protein